MKSDSWPGRSPIVIGVVLVLVLDLQQEVHKLLLIQLKQRDKTCLLYEMEAKDRQWMTICGLRSEPQAQGIAKSKMSRNCNTHRAVFCIKSAYRVFQRSSTTSSMINCPAPENLAHVHPHLMWFGAENAQGEMQG